MCTQRVHVRTVEVLEPCSCLSMALFHVKQSHSSRTAHFHSKLAQFRPIPGFSHRFLAQAKPGSMWEGARRIGSR